MIFQAYQTLTDFNRTGLDALFAYPASVVPSFAPLLLFTIFSIAMLASFFSEKRAVGRGDIRSSFAAAGFLTAIVAFVMTLIDGFINSFTVGIAVVVAVIGALLLFTSGDRD